MVNLTHVEIEVRVAEALSNAVYENNHTEMLTAPAHEVAVDLGTYCPALEGQEPELLVEAITQWQLSHANQT